MSRTRLLVYSDHLGEKVQPIKRLYHEAKIRPLVQNFLLLSVDAFRHQYATLSLHERSIVEEFNDLLELAEHYASQKQNFEAISFALTTAIQVAELLMFVSIDPSK